MDIKNYCEHLKKHPDFGDKFVFYKHTPEQNPNFNGKISLNPIIENVLHDSGYKQLFSHQTEAVNQWFLGNNIIVSTPTASGKTLIFNVVMLEEILRNPSAKALYLFPLKALEHDQLKVLKRWMTTAEKYIKRSINGAIYDGDTPSIERKKIKADLPDVLFTNPDMLHRGILAYHDGWCDFFKKLKLIVVDELHVYRGILGSHINQIFRRLNRLCSYYGSSPRFIMLSATLGNPQEFAETLINKSVKAVSVSGAPASGQNFLLLNPEIGNSANFSAAKLMAHTVKSGFRTIAFAQSRKVAELISIWISDIHPELREKIRPYRAGFLPSERRRIEKDLVSGKLMGVVSTSALELGIDIGLLDVCILVGYPGTIMKTWQRGGRVGRSGRESLVIMVAKPDALDQYFVKHPEDIFERSFEAAVLDPENSIITEAHIPCAASEIPVSKNDVCFWGKNFYDRIHNLEKKNLLLRSADGLDEWYPSSLRPHLGVNIRPSGEIFTVFETETGQAIGTVSGNRVFKECHEGAIYLHNGERYTVNKLFIEKRDIVVNKIKSEYFTRVFSKKETEILEIKRSRSEVCFTIKEGLLKVTEKITGYEKRRLPGNENIGEFPLELPDRVFETTGFWIEIEPYITRMVEAEQLNFMGGIHAIEHGIIGMFPLFVLCDRDDMGGISYPLYPQINKSAIFIYDGYEGGVGLASRGFDMIMELLSKTKQCISECECEGGCPSCIHSPKCGNGNKPLDKKAAILIMNALLEGTASEKISHEISYIADAVSYKNDIVAKPHSIAPSPRILVFDLETRNLSHEVGGWKNIHLLRLSVAVIWDSVTDSYFTFEEKDVENLIDHLKSADIVIGFNVEHFDYKVLQAYSNTDFKKIYTFDMLKDIESRIGFKIGLGHLATETLGSGKSADGLLAVQWFREGKIDLVKEYCQKDVEVTRDLFMYGCNNGYIVYKRKDKRVRLPLDWNINELLKSKIFKLI